jgi:hypothetical protein
VKLAGSGSEGSSGPEALLLLLLHLVLSWVKAFSSTYASKPPVCAMGSAGDVKN